MGRFCGVRAEQVGFSHGVPEVFFVDDVVPGDNSSTQPHMEITTAGTVPTPSVAACPAPRAHVHETFRRPSP
jgi:hypothetical protein